MTPTFHLLHSFSVITADFLVASIWQALVLALSAALLLRLLPGLTAAVRSAIWSLVLVLLLIVPALSLILHTGSSATSASASLWHTSDRWSVLLLGVWAALSLLRFTQLTASAIRLQRLARRATVLVPLEPVAALLRRSRRPVSLCLSAELDRPSVAGFFRPRILLSPQLYQKLSAPELEQVILHEVEHLRRYDDWTNLLQKFSLAMLPIHPVLLWLDRQMCLERELACDDSVLRQTRARKSYAACLTHLAEHSLLRRGFSLALGALGSRERISELSLRVHRILATPERKMNPARAWVTASALFVALFAGAAGLARSPQLISFTTPSIPATRASYFPAMQNVAYRSTSSHTAWVDATFHANIPHPSKTLAMVPAVARTSAPRTQFRPKNSTRSNTLQRTFVQRRSYATLISARTVTLPTGLTLTISRTPDQQFLYAAVPLRDGWLILQL